MSGWSPPDSTLIQGSNGEPSSGWEPPDSTLIGDASDNSSGTRVENPVREAMTKGAAEGLGAGAGMFAGAKLGGSLTRSPWGVGVGALTGAVVGGVGMSAITEAAGLRSPQEMAPDQRAEAETAYSFGGGVGAMLTPFGAGMVGLRLLEAGPGKWLANAIRQTKRTPKTLLAVETGTVTAAAAGAGGAEILMPGSQLASIGGEIAGAGVYMAMSPLTWWNVGNKAFNAAMGKWGRNATERQLAGQLLKGMNEAGTDPAQVIKVLEAGNPYGLTAAQLTADKTLMEMERALSKKSDPFHRSLQEKGYLARQAMTAQINLLKMDGNPEHLGAIAEIRKAQYESIMSERVTIATAEAKRMVEQGVRKGMTDENIGDISARARGALDSELDRAEDYVSDLYSAVKLDIPVEMKRTQEVIDEILSRSADTLKGQKIPSYLTSTIGAAKTKAKGATTYDPDTFVIRDGPDGPVMSDSRNLIDIRRQLLSDARAAEIDPAKAMQAGLNKRLQSAIMDDLDAAFKDGMDDSYDAARAANRAMNDVFERSFAGKAMSLGKRGDVIDPREMLKRAFATGGEAASLKLQDLEEATRFMVSRGMADDGATDVMLKAQEDAYRLITTAAMKDGRINPDTMKEYIRINGRLFNRPPFTDVRDDLLEAIKSEKGLRRLEDFKNRRDNDIGKNSAFARISGTNPVDYASRILVSTGDQESQFIKMFNMAKKGGTNRQGVVTVTSEQGISSARASILNAAYNRSLKGSTLDIDTFRQLLFTPNVAGQKSPITIMREQGVIEPDHIKNLSKLFNALDTLKIAERQGVGVDMKQGIGELGFVVGAKIAMSRLAGALNLGGAQSGAGIIIAGNVAKATEAVVSKIPAARVDEVAIKLANDPEALANVLKKVDTAQQRMLQLTRFHSWIIQTGLTASRDDFEPIEMFSQ